MTLPTLVADAAGHVDPVASVVLALAVMLLAAKLGGDLALRLSQLAVLGELLGGALLGNLYLLGFTGFDHLKTDAAIETLAGIGVLLLLFEVGLESTVAQMLEVGLSSFLVATLGVVAPFALGWGVGAWLMPQASPYVHAFLGATLCATSVGITARVLKELRRSQTDEAGIILGAAVIDDVLGLAILAVVTGVIVAADRGGAFCIGATFTLSGVPLIDPATFSAVVVMVMVTTMITPPALKWSLGRARRRAVVT